jgi:hypothetical protein
MSRTTTLSSPKTKNWPDWPAVYENMENNIDSTEKRLLLAPNRARVI